MNHNKERGFFSQAWLKSRIKSANTQNSERWLGYFFGPCLMYMVYYAVAGTYLTQFYTDVLGISGIFLTMMPVVSKIVDAATNVIMGRIIDKTHTSQGKARPWLLLSGFLIALTGILLYTVPQAEMGVQLVWVVFSYNLFFALAFTIYNMSHSLMVPLSTRNTKQRDTLALLTSTGASMIPGMLVTVILPVVIARIGVGRQAQASWIMVMSIVSILAIPAVLMEYYFTKERVTEDIQGSEEQGETERITFVQQMKACLSNPYWLIVMGIWILYQVTQYLVTNSMLYYCNWVLSDSVNGGAAMQILVNTIGQAPLGIGVFILWPLVRKFGKRYVSMIGYGMAAVGGLIVVLSGNHMGGVLGGLVLKSFGLLPTYVFMAMLAEALDHIEWTNRYRADGFSASVYSIIITVTAGIAQTIILGGISGFGYIAPETSAQVISQPDAVQWFFKMCFAGIPAIGYLIMSLLMLRFDVEELIPQISSDLTERRKAEAAARGEVYLSPEEKAQIEQQENDRIAEEKRLEELRERCAKKRLNFEEEEAKYQRKLAERRVKQEAREKAKASKRKKQ